MRHMAVTVDDDDGIWGGIEHRGGEGRVHAKRVVTVTAMGLSALCTAPLRGDNVDMAHNEDRQGLEVLTPETCWQLMAATPVGRIAFVDAGEPIVLPVTHAIDGHQIVFRTADGAKLATASMERPVTFEVDDYHVADRSGWSVLAKGVAELVLNSAEEARLDTIGLTPWADAVQRGQWVRIRVNEITGRRLIPAN